MQGYDAYLHTDLSRSKFRKQNRIRQGPHGVKSGCGTCAKTRVRAVMEDNGLWSPFGPEASPLSGTEDSSNSSFPSRAPGLGEAETVS